MTSAPAFFREAMNMLIAISMDLHSSDNSKYIQEQLLNSSGGVKTVNIFINGSNSKRVSAVIDGDLLDPTSFVRIVQQYDEERD